MRLLIEKDDSAIVEVKDICSIPSDADVLVFHSSVHLKSDDIARIEEFLSKKTMRRCVVLPSTLGLEGRLTGETGR